MNGLKKYMLLLSAVVFILLGASLPYLTSKAQDARISDFQKKLELSTVNLTLRQENDVRPVLQLISEKHTESLWEGETVLSRADACQAALVVLETMEQYDLLPKGGLKRFRKTEGYAEPQLLVGEDGSSALIWICTWEDVPGTIITLDDATGEAVRLLTDRARMEKNSEEDICVQVEKWIVFFQNYYEIDLEMEYNVELVEADEGTSKDGPGMLSNEICFSSKDAAMPYDLNLELADDCVFFNYP